MMAHQIGALALLLTLSSATGQNTITGRVIDADSGEPVAEVSVRLAVAESDGPAQVRGEASTITDGTGLFYFVNVPRGAYTLAIEHMAYEDRETEVEVTGEGDLNVTIPITIRPIELDPIMVTMRLHRLDAVGFYNRQERGVGTFINHEDIEKARLLSDLTSRFPGMGMDRRLHGNHRMRIRGNKTLFSNCKTQFILDGVPVQLPTGIDEIPPSNVYGMEIYKGSSQVPTQYSTGTAMCGAVLIWTKEGDRGARRRSPRP